MRGSRKRGRGRERQREAAKSNRSRQSSQNQILSQPRARDERAVDQVTYIYGTGRANCSVGGACARPELFFAVGFVNRGSYSFPRGLFVCFPSGASSSRSRRIPGRRLIRPGFGREASCEYKDGNVSRKKRKKRKKRCGWHQLRCRAGRGSSILCNQ